MAQEVGCRSMSAPRVNTIQPMS